MSPRRASARPFLVGSAALCLLLAATRAQAGAITGAVAVSGPAEADRTVVYVDSVPEGSFEARSAKLSQKGARFNPSVLPVVRGNSVDLTNDDWVAHSVFSKSELKPFDLGIYSPGGVKSVSFEREGVVDVFCAIHPRMNAAVLVLQNPYFAKPDAQGRFKIDGVPAGSYTLKLYRHGSKATAQPVVVPASGAAEVKF
jgi:plastocyanin